MNPQVLSAPGRPRLMHDVVPPYAKILAQKQAPANVPAPQPEIQAAMPAPEVPVEVAQTAPVEQAVQTNTEPMLVEPSAHPALVETPAQPAVQPISAEALEQGAIMPTSQPKIARSRSHLAVVTIALLVSAALLAAAFYAFSQRGA